MSYYQLPRTNFFIPKYIDYIVSDNNPPPFISNSLSMYLSEIKQRLEEIENEWDIHKKYTNPYEFIHTLIPGNKTSISKLKPLSRSFYKMIEMCNLLHILNDLPNNKITEI